MCKTSHNFGLLFVKNHIIGTCLVLLKTTSKLAEPQNGQFYGFMSLCNIVLVFSKILAVVLEGTFTGIFKIDFAQ
jgi:hypothetical protein